MKSPAERLPMRSNAAVRRTICSIQSATRAVNDERRSTASASASSKSTRRWPCGPMAVLNPHPNLLAFSRLKERICLSGVPHLESPGGLFVPYGRFYLETVGNHVEIGVIPCGNPDDALKNELRFTRLLKDCLASMRRNWPGINLLKNNCDYNHGRHVGFARELCHYADAP